MDRLVEAGLPVKQDLDQAWRDFAGWRVNYDETLLRICAARIGPGRAVVVGPGRAPRTGARRAPRPLDGHPIATAPDDV